MPRETKRPLREVIRSEQRREVRATKQSPEDVPLAEDGMREA
jgi:hypothetical protein